MFKYTDFRYSLIIYFVIFIPNFLVMCFASAPKLAFNIDSVLVFLIIHLMVGFGFWIAAYLLGLFNTFFSN